MGLCAWAAVSRKQQPCLEELAADLLGSGCVLPFRELQNTPDAVPDGGIEPPPLDTAWVEATRKKALLKLEKLDTDLKNYKGNSIKESIR